MSKLSKFTAAFLLALSVGAAAPTFAQSTSGGQSGGGNASAGQSSMGSPERSDRSNWGWLGLLGLIGLAGLRKREDRYGTGAGRA